MRRRDFLSALAALPLVGRFVPSQPPAPALPKPTEPDISFATNATTLDSVQVGTRDDVETIMEFRDGAWRLVREFPEFAVYVNGAEVTFARPYPVAAETPVCVQIVGRLTEARPRFDGGAEGSIGYLAWDHKCQIGDDSPEWARTWRPPAGRVTDTPPRDGRVS